MDDIDKKIIEILKRNSRKSYTKIAKEVGLTEGAVRRRIKMLVKRGIIKRFTIEVSEEKGLIKALCFVKVDPRIETSKVSEVIKKLPDILWCYEISGDYDIVCMIAKETIKDINDTIERIRRIEGVIYTSSSLILKE